MDGPLFSEEEATIVTVEHLDGTRQRFELTDKVELYMDGDDAPPREYAVLLPIPDTEEELLVLRYVQTGESTFKLEPVNNDLEREMVDKMLLDHYKAKEDAS